MIGSFSGGGSSFGGGSSCDGFNLDICPDLLLAGLAILAAGAFAALFTAIVMAGRRKRRSLNLKINKEFLFHDLVWLGT